MPYTPINKQTEHFNTKLYDGDGSSTHAITGVGHQPDWVWIKKRDGVENHFAFDAVRGQSKYIYPNSSSAEGTSASGVFKSFDSDGFTVANNDGVNENNKDFVSWNWKAGGGQGSSNTDGSINTTYTSANTTAGFSISSYTGTGSNATVGHGLGAVPQVVLIKELNGTNNWIMSHQPLSASLGDYTRFLTLNSTSAVSGAGNVLFQSSAFTSSVFNVGTSAATNGSGGANFIAYCFAEKPGFSKFGVYKGNGSSDGTFVYTGFKPSWLFIKRTDSGGDNSIILDVKRDEIAIPNRTNPLTEGLFPNSDAAETGNYTIDFLANGFKAKTTASAVNGGGATYAYMAFGQSLVGSNNVPCNAR